MNPCCVARWARGSSAAARCVATAASASCARLQTAATTLFLREAAAPSAQTALT